MFCGGAISLTALLSGLFPAFISSRTDVATVLRSAGSRNRTAGPAANPDTINNDDRTSSAGLRLVNWYWIARPELRGCAEYPARVRSPKRARGGDQPGEHKYKEQSQADAFFKSVLEKVSEVPGVTTAALSDDPPFVNSEGGEYSPFIVPSQPPVEPGREPTLNGQNISPGYFRTLKASIVEGRDFNYGDTRDKQGVVIVNRTLADTYFPGQSAISKQIELPGSYMAQKRLTIVGVVQDMRHGGPNNSPKFSGYFPFLSAVYSLRNLTCPISPRSVGIATGFTTSRCFDRS